MIDILDICLYHVLLLLTFRVSEKRHSGCLNIIMYDHQMAMTFYD